MASMMVRSHVAGRLGTVAAYIRTHLDEPLNLASIAGHAGFSRYHFHRIFRMVMGEPLGAFVRRERLQRAAVELRSGRRAVTEIARAAGYRTASAFTRAFTNHFRVPPREFRANGALPVVPEHALPRFYEQPMAVSVVELPAREVLALRHVGPYRDALGPLMRVRTVATQSFGSTGQPEILGLSYDDPATNDQWTLRFDACMPYRKDAAASPLRALSFEGGRYAAYRHVGPFELIEHVFDRLFDAVVFSGCHVLRAAPCVEIYSNGLGDDRSDIFTTDVHIPIR